MKTKEELPWRQCSRFVFDLGHVPRGRYDAIPVALIDACRALIKATCGEMPPKYRILADGVRMRTGGRFQEEAEALAERLKMDWREIILVNISYDLALAQFGCSTLVLPGPNGPVIARNMDWWPERLLAQASCVLSFEKDGASCFEHAGWPAAIGVVSGLSANGFAVILNAVSGPEGVDIKGYPVLLFLRTVVEDAASFEEALELLKKEHLAAPALFTLVGSQNVQRVVIERSPKRYSLRWGESGKPLVTTNDYRVLFCDGSKAMDELNPAVCGRFDALVKRYSAYTSSSAPEWDDLLGALTDLAVIQDITAQHVLIYPDKRRMELFVPRRLLVN